MQTSPPQAKSQPAAANRRWALLLVSAAIAFYWGSLYLYVPTLGVFARSFGLSASVVGTILSMYGLWQAIVRLPLGITADWLGKRKPFIIAGCLLSSLGAVLMGSAGGEFGLLTGRSVTGLAAAAWVPLVVLFSGFFPPEQAVRASAILSMINLLSRVIATSLTGYLNAAFDYPMAFYLAAILGGLAILLILPIREQTFAPKPPTFNQVGLLVTRRDVLVPSLLATVAQYVAWATTFGFIPILAAERLGAPPESLGLLTSLNLFVGMGGNLIITWAAHRVRNLHLVTLSFAILTAGLILTAFAPDMPVLYIAQALLGLGSGICTPLLMGMSIEKVSEAQRATAMGLHQAVYAIGMFAGPWLSGILVDSIGMPNMFILTAIGSLALAWGLSRFLRKSAP